VGVCNGLGYGLAVSNNFKQLIGIGGIQRKGKNLG
jgi:hypothetical protein